VDLSTVLPALVARYVPITRWLPEYPREWLRPDLVAAVTSWGVMVPVALAYAGLAGVPPEVGLVTAFTALAAYAMFGTSRHLKVTVSSTMAVMSASVVAGLAGGDATLYVALTAALALVVGGMLVAAGIAKLGFISDFLTKSVVTGFIFGLAITIIIGQLPKILGVPSLSGSLPEQVVQLVGYLPDTNPYTLAVGVTALVLILVLRRISRKIPGPLIALVLGILAVTVLGLEAYGVSVVGEVATGLPLPSIPMVPLTTIPYLALGAAGIVFLAVGESVGAGRAYAARHQYEIDPDQEMLALGAANLASGLFGGFSADASLSQTATAESAGAKSQLASLVTSGLILATAVLLAPLFQNLPRAVLLSVMFVLYKASRPYVAALGRMPGHRGTFGDLTRHPDAEPVPWLVIIRLDAPLYFFNANVAKKQIQDLVAAQQPEPRGVLIDLAATADLDVTTADMLAGLIADLHARSIEVLLAQVKGRVRDRLLKTGVMTELGEDRVYLSIGSAVTDFQLRWPPEAVSGSEAAAAAAAGAAGAEAGAAGASAETPPEPQREREPRAAAEPDPAPGPEPEPATAHEPAAEAGAKVEPAAATGVEPAPKVEPPTG
jgi:MFS superfamily sulfate permease-like transporter